MFMDKIYDLELKDQVTNSTKATILKYLKLDMSVKSISRIIGVSDSYVSKFFSSVVDCPTINFGEVLCIDEFKNLKKSDGKYALAIYDPIDHVVNDVLPSRTLIKLNNYFSHFEPKILNHVKYFISDMYETYRTIKRTFFHNATHVVDSFHYIRWVTDAFDKVRIRIQESFDRKTWQYKILKNNIKLLNHRLTDLSNKRDLYNPKSMRHHCTSSEIITTALEVSSELSEAYDLLQDFLIGWDKTKMENAEDFIYESIRSFGNSNLPEFIAVSHTFMNWKKEIMNSFIRLSDRRLNNGYIEGINNRIKAIKKAAYGFRSFENFRLRIMYVINPTITYKIKK